MPDTICVLKAAIAGINSLGNAKVGDKTLYDTQPVLYPDIAIGVAEAVRDGQADRGALFCGTGIGMAISANKVEKIKYYESCYSK